MSQACRRLTEGFCVAVAIALIACGGGSGTSSPAAPTPAPAPAPAPTTPTVTALNVTGAGCVADFAGTAQFQTLCTAEKILPGSTLQLTATATLSDSTTQNVTSQAQWTSTNQNVATVNASGLVTILRTGETDVVAAYQGKSAGHTVRTKLQVVYTGTTSQGLPFLLHTYSTTDPYYGNLRQILYMEFTMRHRLGNGSTLDIAHKFTATCTEERAGGPGSGGTGVFRCTWDSPMTHTEIDAAIQGDGAIAGTMEDTGIGPPPALERVQTVVNFTVRPS